MSASLAAWLERRAFVYLSFCIMRGVPGVEKRMAVLGSTAGRQATCWWLQVCDNGNKDI